MLVVTVIVIIVVVVIVVMPNYTTGVCIRGRNISTSSACIPFLFAGSGYSATRLFADLMHDGFALDIGHERVGRDGASSWWFTLPCNTYRVKNPHQLTAINPATTFCRAVALVRTPLGVVASGLSIEWPVRGYCGMPTALVNSTQPLACRLLEWWLEYTRAALALPNLVAVFRVGVDTFLHLFTECLRLECDIVCWRRIAESARRQHNPHVTRARVAKHTSWQALTATCPDTLVDAAAALARHCGVY